MDTDTVDKLAAEYADLGPVPTDGDAAALRAYQERAGGLRARAEALHKALDAERAALARRQAAVEAAVRCLCDPFMRDTALIARIRVREDSARAAADDLSGVTVRARFGPTGAWGRYAVRSDGPKRALIAQLGSTASPSAVPSGYIEVHPEDRHLRCLAGR